MSLARHNAPTRKQIALAHVAKARLGLSEAAYRGLLERAAGVRSAAQLDRAGMAAVLDEFARLGFESDARRRTYGERRDMASPAEVAYIRRLWADFTSGEGTDASLNKWLDGHFHIAALRFLPARLAPKVITALKRMNERRWGGDDAPS